MPAISLALPEPTYVAASGLERCCSKPSHTTAPAVSASAANSLNDSSALACVVTADDQTPTSTTRSRRTLRYSTSVTSCSSPRPATCLSSLRASRSSHSWLASSCQPVARWLSSSNTSDCSASTPSGVTSLLPRLMSVYWVLSVKCASFGWNGSRFFYGPLLSSHEVTCWHRSARTGIGRLIQVGIRERRIPQKWSDHGRTVFLCGTRIEGCAPHIERNVARP